MDETTAPDGSLTDGSLTDGSVTDSTVLDAAPDGVADAGDAAAPADDVDGSAAEPAVDLLLVTGLSGAGRSTTANALEDLGWYVVDNLPPQMLGALAGLAARAGTAVPRVAVVLDVRVRGFASGTGGIAALLLGATQTGVRRRVLFLEASDDVLVRRFESVRRPHPLQGEGRVLDGIVTERELLRDLRAAADMVIDTSERNVHQLSAAINDAFGQEERTRLRLTLVSFGFKYGLPTDADHVVDVRFLPNPFWVPALRGRTGRDEAVRDYVLGQDGAEEFVQAYARALAPVIAGYQREHRSYATIAIGCTGGKHRSVAMSERLAGVLREQLAEDPLGDPAAADPSAGDSGDSGDAGVDGAGTPHASVRGGAPAVGVVHRDLGKE